MQKKEFTSYAKEIQRSINYIAYTVTSSRSMYFEDVKQELLIASWKSYQTYDPDKAKFSTYAVNRMKKLAINLRRQLERDKTFTFVTKTDEKRKIQIPIADFEEVNHPYIDTNFTSLEEDQERKQEDQIRKTNVKNISQVLRRHCNHNEQFKKANYIFSMLVLGISLSECARRMNVSVSWISRVFRNYIIPIAHIVTVKGVDVDKSTVYNAVRILKPKEENMATKKNKKFFGKSDKSVQSQKANKSQSVGKKTSKDGLVAKIKFLEANFVNKGRTRSEAVAGLTDRYPDISINYARTIVYSQMKEYDWAASEPRAKAKKVASSKKAVPSKRKEIDTKKNSQSGGKGSKSKKTKIDKDDDSFVFEDDEDDDEVEEEDDTEDEDDDDDEDDIDI